MNMLSRRQFLWTTGTGLAALSVLRADAPADRMREGKPCPPDRKLRIACVGCGGQGRSDIGNVAGEEIVALCDVDSARAEETFKKYPNVPKFKDYREMLLKMDEQIDAVTVTVPDHMHFPIAMMAIQMGKHVYVQKPLTHVIAEARLLREAAAKHKVITQMGNQGHAGEGCRLLREWVQAGVIGPVTEAHVWTNRPIWPQGVKRPAQGQPVPPTLDWNLWQGVAQERPYHSDYLPFKWRGWWEYGTGALGDMGCHTMDGPVYALDLFEPLSVEADAKDGNEDSGPTQSTVTYQFPARGDMPPLKLVWYEGGRKPPRPAGLEEGRKLPNTGFYLVGEKGIILDMTDYCQSPRIIPESKMQEMARSLPPKTIPRVKGGPHQEWITACKGGPLPGSNFEYSTRLTETVLLGNLALRTGKKALWDAKAMKCTNIPEANALVTKPYRKF